MGSNDFGCSRSGVRAACYSAEGVSRATASPPAAFRAPGPPSTQPSKTASLALTAVLRPPRGRKRKRKERPRYRCLAGARPGPARPAAGAAYLGAAVEGGLAEGAAAQGADGDVVQLLLLAGKAAAAAAAGAAPA